MDMKELAGIETMLESIIDQYGWHKLAKAFNHLLLAEYDDNPRTQSDLRDVLATIELTTCGILPAAPGSRTRRDGHAG